MHVLIREEDQQLLLLTRLEIEFKIELKFLNTFKYL